MKKIIGILLGISLGLTGFGIGKPRSPVPVSAEEEKTVKLLAIGNSFSEDALTYLREVSLAAGEDVAVHHLVIGGSSLEQHWTNAQKERSVYTFVKKHTKSFSRSDKKLRDGLEYDRYDYVVLQQVSGLSGVAESYEPYLSNLIDYLREFQPTAEILFHQTWAYEVDSTHVDFPRYQNSRHVMYERIKETTEQASFTHGLSLIPSGEAYHLARENPLFDVEKGGNSLCRDGYHASEAGRVMLAFVWNRILTGKKAVDNPYTHNSVDADELQILKEAADYATDEYTKKQIANVKLIGNGKFDVLQNGTIADKTAFLQITYRDGQIRELTCDRLRFDTSVVGKKQILYRYGSQEFPIEYNVISRERVDLLKTHIESVVRFPNVNDIESLLRDYDSLSPTEQAGVTNYDELLSLKERYLNHTAPETPPSKPSSLYWLFLIPVIGLIVAGIVLYARKKRKNNRIDSNKF